jgi:transcriptional regulator GlxA family with amidase domain
MWAEQFARKYPLVKVDPDVLYVDDGEILTSAGTAAGIDLCLHVVRLDYGAEAANIVARRMVVPPHRDGGQAQYVTQPVSDLPPCDPFTETLAWAVEHLDGDLSVGELAARSAMSPRTFARRFGDSHGTTPHQWLLRQRVLLAQRLLETTDLSVDQVAARCGVGSAANLRQHFQRIVRNTPQGYRRCFQQGCDEPKRPPSGIAVDA